jgi:diguanylate cyclase (GGDEF)-like protein
MSLISTNESHRIVQLLEESTASAETLIDELPGVFIILNEKNQILRGNIQCSELFDCDPEDLLRSDFKSLFLKETWTIFNRHLTIIRNQTDPKARKEFELPILHPQKGECPHHWFISKQKSKNISEGILTIVLGQDISTLRESEKKLLEVFTTINMGIFLVNSQGQIEGGYSSYLENILNQTDLEKKSVLDVLFSKDHTTFSKKEWSAVHSLINDGFNKSFNDIEDDFNNFPKEMHYGFLNPDSELNGIWLKVSCKPILSNGTLKRILFMLEDDTNRKEAEQAKLLAAQLEQQQKEIYQKAVRDSLTGLYNRHYISDGVKVLMQNHNRGQLDHLSLIMFDIDHFKTVNDTYGHPVGDDVLSSFGRVILKQIRESDIAIRFGGEEIMLFAATPASIAIKLAERIRKELSDIQFNGNNITFNVTTSAGIAEHSKDETMESLMERADAQLYIAKRNGRNCCKIDGISDS